MTRVIGGASSALISEARARSASTTSSSPGDFCSSSRCTRGERGAAREECEACMRHVLVSLAAAGTSMRTSEGMENERIGLDDKKDKKRERATKEKENRERSKHDDKKGKEKKRGRDCASPSPSPSSLSSSPSSASQSESDNSSEGEEQGVGRGVGRGVGMVGPAAPTSAQLQLAKDAKKVSPMEEEEEEDDYGPSVRPAALDALYRRLPVVLSSSSSSFNAAMTPLGGSEIVVEKQREKTEAEIEEESKKGREEWMLTPGENKSFAGESRTSSQLLWINSMTCADELLNVSESLDWC